MVAMDRRRVRCVIVAVPDETPAWTSRGALAHELLPGADPYVAQLIRRLQDEVRAERRLAALERRARQLAARHVNDKPAATQPRFAQHQLAGDLEIPWFDMPLEDAPFGDQSVPEYGDPTDDAAPAW